MIKAMPVLFRSSDANCKLSCLFTILFSLVFSFGAFTQAPPTAGDCLGGFRVCEQSYTQASSFIGEGNNLSELPTGTCLLNSGERNNAWYIVSIEAQGIFGFNVIPNVSNADYDWIVFDITNATCNDIASGLVPVLGCDFASNVTPSPVTGMNNGTNPQDEAMVNVPQGTILALCINNFSGLNNAGYTLQFNIPGTTAGIIDNEPPQLFPVADASCGSSLITFKFNEFVVCESVDVADFTLINPLGDTIEINSIVGQACANGGTYEKDFVLVLNEPLFISGFYQLWRNGQIVDLCGNVAANPENIPIQISAFELATSNLQPATCPTNNGDATATLTLTDPLDTFTYTWYPSGFSSPPSANTSSTNTALPYGTNWVVVENQNGCLRADTFQIDDTGGFTVNAAIIDDTCSTRKGQINLTVNPIFNGANPVPYLFFWDTPGQLFDTSSAFDLLTGMYNFTVTNPAGCTYRDSAFVPDFRYSLSADFLYSPDEDPITGMFPTVTFVNLSQFATEFIWDFGSGDTSDVFEPQYIFPGSGTYDVQLMAINQFGCKDSVTKQITIDFLLNLYFPTAFTPDGDNINDTFNFVASGILDSTFIMQIFDKWGGLVYETKDLRKGWDGKSIVGAAMPSGVYTYKIFFYDQSGKKRQIRGRFLIYS